MKKVPNMSSSFECCMFSFLYSLKEIIQSSEMEGYTKDFLSLERGYGNSLNVHRRKMKSIIKYGMAYSVKHIINIIGYVLIISNLTSSPHCMLKEEIGRSYLISALLTGAGLSYLLTDILSNNLSVSSGARLGYLVCTLLFLNQKEEKCPGAGDIYAMGVERKIEWQTRIKTVQGAVLIACMTQMVIALLGIKFLASYIRPISIVPTILLTSISITKTSAITMASSCLGLFSFTTFIVFISYCIFLYFTPKRKHKASYAVSSIHRNLYIAVVCVLISWFLCFLLSHVNFFESKSAARTDVFMGVMDYTSNFNISYFFCWGKPLWKFEAISLILPASFISLCEVLTNYYNSLEESQKSRTLIKHWKNSTWISLIIFEAGFCLLTTLMGTVLGIELSFEKYEQKKKYFGTIVGIILIIMGISGQLCSAFTLVPEPLVSVLIFAVFVSAFLESLNLSRLIQLENRKNLFVLGTSLFVGFTIPVFVRHNLQHEIGSSNIRDVLMSLLSAEFIVGGLVAVTADNLIQTFLPEKKLIAFVQPSNNTHENSETNSSMDCCDCLFPFFM